MRTLTFVAPVLAFTSAFLVYGCTLDLGGIAPSTGSTSGDPSTTAASGSGGASVSTGSTTGTGGAGGSGGSVTATASSTGTCMPSQEVCDDGLDNDCDGHVDCDDTDCSGPVDGRACVPEAPAGWTLSTRAPDTGAGCPAGYTNPVPLALPPTSASATCDCNCGAPQSNPCTSGTLTVTIGSGCSANKVVSTVTGACDTLGSLFSGSHTSCGGSLVTTPVACDVSYGKPASVPSSVDVTCAPAASAAGGCNGGQVCLPKVTSGKLCIQAAGDTSCPAGPFSVRSVVGTPGDVSDQRSCDACTCMTGSPSCGAATFTAYTDAACSQNGSAVAIDGGCHSASSGQFSGDTHFKYAAANNGTACAASSATTALTGEFKPANPITICCQP